MPSSNQQYSQNIFFSKLISIIAIISLVCILIYNMIGDQISPTIDKKASDLKKYDVSITKSIIEGADNKGKNYIIKSESILKSTDDLYHLDNISGLYNLSQINLEMIAKTGLMNDKTKILHLEEQIALEYDGYILTTHALNVNLTTMSAASNQPVNIIHNRSNISADSFELDSQNKTLDFEGNVKTYVKISDF